MEIVVTGMGWGCGEGEVQGCRDLADLMPKDRRGAEVLLFTVTTCGRKITDV